MAAPIGRTVFRLPGPRALVLLGLVFLLAGCDAVQEDRTIEFSAEADSVGFQHGDQGVFVADKDGGGLKKVFQPGADVLATSTPLWSPTGAAADLHDGPRGRRRCGRSGLGRRRQLRGLLRRRTDPDPAGDALYPGARRLHLLAAGRGERRAAGETVRREMRPRRLCRREPRRALAPPR